jgi:hypothetical protein
MTMPTMRVRALSFDGAKGWSVMRTSPSAGSMRVVYSL